jgi:myo-inositol-1(or 4)-monophosphatase
MINYRDICDEIVKAAGQAAGFIRKESGSFDIRKTEIKGLHDFVSYVDKGSEKMLVESLSIILPAAGFIAEEGTSSKKGLKYNWVIDPLDGTTNFVHGVHPYAISIGLTEYEIPVAGVVYEVGGNEVFTAWKNGGAWLNGKQIRVSDARLLSESLVATGFPYTYFGRLGNYMRSMTHLCKTTHGVRRLGAASVDLAYVACGRFEAFYEYGLKPWDIAAGILLVREAGGRVSDFAGNEINLTGDEIIAANSLVFPEFLENVSKFMAG